VAYVLWIGVAGIIRGVDEWLRGLPGEFAYNAVYDAVRVALVLGVGFAVKKLIRRRPTVKPSAATANIATSGSATPTVLKPLSATAELRPITVVREKALLSALSELLYWWSQVR
jgi:hypothetical protein